jgi:NAD(P) transhydrogenase subunit alpha
MDALSSQASLAGYKAVLLAASELPKYFPMLMTAAGTVRPAKVVVLGAGVAGLQAIATARRLGAVVEASDVRTVVKEQVQSLGAAFIEPPAGESAEGEGGYAREVSADYLARQQAIVAEHMQRADVVITTALVPGRAAPKLIPASVVERMKPGSVIVDLAAAQGGNCALCEPGRSVRKHGVLIIGHMNLAATMPADASMLYARNVLELVKEFVKKGDLALDPNNDVLQGALLTHAGKIPNTKLADQLGLGDLKPPGGTPGEEAA